MNIVVTGGAGYIGSYVCRVLIAAGHKIVVVDDLSTGKQSNLASDAVFIAGDFADQALWQTIILQYTPELVIHLAAKINAVESITQAELYLEENFTKTKKLLEILASTEILGVVYASSAAVYGDGEQIPTPETAQTKPLNPYGQSKLLAEQALQEFSKTGKKAIVLRFFNVAGKLTEVDIGPGLEAALLTAIKKCLTKKTQLKIFGDSYPTKDGTCQRDFVHVADIAQAFNSVVNNFSDLDNYEVINIGTGQSHSVMEVVNKAEVISGQKINYQIVEPRDNEIVISVADNAKMKRLLHLQLNHSDLETIIRTSL